MIIITFFQITNISCKKYLPTKRFLQQNKYHRGLYIIYSYSLKKIQEKPLKNEKR